MLDRLHHCQRTACHVCTNTYCLCLRCSHHKPLLARQHTIPCSTKRCLGGVFSRVARATSSCCFLLLFCLQIIHPSTLLGISKLCTQSLSECAEKLCRVHHLFVHFSISLWRPSVDGFFRVSYDEHAWVSYFPRFRLHV